MSKPLRIGWLSNAPFCPTGYGTQSRLILDRLKTAGHEPIVFCTHGLEHGKLDTPAYRMLPKGNDYWSQDVVGEYSRKYKTDITVCFLDAWVMKPWVYGPNVRAVTLFPVDHEPLADNVRNAAAGFWDRICYSQSAVKVVREAGLECHYVPHGIETDVFKPLDRIESRQICDIPQDRFVVGVVAANHDPMPAPRKNWKNILEGFKLFKDRHCPDAILYLHTPLMTTTGVDIKTKMGKLGLQGSVYASDQSQLRDGFPDGWMAHLYNAFDVLLAPSMGEGFCLPVVEAQACGTPVITSGWSATAELCFSGLLIDKSEARAVETGDFVYWYEAEAEVVCQYLAAFYGMEAHWPMMRQVAREKALDYDIDTIFANYWVPTLGNMAERISEENASVGVSLRPRPDAKYREMVREETIKAVERDPPQVVIVCPSAGEKCGIAEYAKSAQRSLSAAGVASLILPTVEAGGVAALADSVESLLILHEYAFFDDLNPRLSRGETTSGMIRALRTLKELKPNLKLAIQMHTVTEQNGERPLNGYLAEQCKEAGVALFATSMAGALFLSAHYQADSKFLPLGAWTITKPDNVCPYCGKERESHPGTFSRIWKCGNCGQVQTHFNPGTQWETWMPTHPGLPDAFSPPSKIETFSIGNFGMFGAQRDIGAHIELCRDTNSRFVGSFYCEFEAQEEALRATLERDGLLAEAQVFTDWAEESEVVRRLSLASCLYMPRPEVGNHYAAASVVTAMSARRPIIINRAGCYEDLWDVLLVADTLDEAKEIIERLRTDPTYYRAAVERIERYFVERDIAKVWREAGLINWDS